ncbi:DUF1837 domain-containing protein [Acidobacteria bacterium AB60]|nr:DUF1837 domain-containing protein [Acidobacteria bacterium AB60]
MAKKRRIINMRYQIHRSECRLRHQIRFSYPARHRYSCSYRKTHSGSMLSVYDHKPARFLIDLSKKKHAELTSSIYCAGFELGKWRCSQLAFHLAEWLPDYALIEEELRVNHANMLLKLNQAAVRVYTSEKYKKRGEAGEIALHAICRDFFQTIPISPRVFYKSASNDLIKAFDMVHARLPMAEPVELWLGESKLWEQGDSAIANAIKSVRSHIDAGFLANEKLILGPQIPKDTPRYEEIVKLFHKSTSLDAFLKSSVFVVGILCDSESAIAALQHDTQYLSAVEAEMEKLAKSLNESGLPSQLRMVLIYLPLATKESLVAAFDERLKGLQ